MIKEIFTIEDLELVCEISRKTWPVCYKSLLTQSQIQYMLDLFYTPDQLNQNCLTKGHRFFIAYKHDQPLGFASIEMNHQEPLMTKLHKLYVLPDIQSKGIGKELLQMMQSLAMAAGQQRFMLHVNRGNPAIGFYEKLGFTITGSEDFDIGSGHFMNDYRMEKML